MKKLFAGFLFGLLALMLGAASHAAEKGSQEEAIAMVKKAVAYIKANGKEKSFAEFSTAATQFKDRDLYIVVTDFNGTTLAHGANPKLVGKNLIDIKDADGKLFMKAIVDLAKEKGKGWVDYKWVNPATSIIDQKSLYVEKVDDVAVGCGVYK